MNKKQLQQAKTEGDKNYLTPPGGQAANVKYSIKK